MKQHPFFSSLILLFLAGITMTGCQQRIVPGATANAVLKGYTSILAYHYEATAYEVQADGQRNLVVRMRLYSSVGTQGPLRSVSGSLLDYNAIHAYLLNSIQQDFSLQHNGRESSPSSCLFENGYNVAPYETFHLTFPLSGRKGNLKAHPIQLRFNDKWFSHHAVIVPLA